VVRDEPVMVTPEHARMVMEVYLAADLSAERNEPVTLPLPLSSLDTERLSAKAA
jgi:myo-inositol 2-dehydrogenase/D-chiro-inositol 1-dehydrogenase